jgi:hypothetical protein
VDQLFNSFKIFEQLTEYKAEENKIQLEALSKDLRSIQQNFKEMSCADSIKNIGDSLSSVQKDIDEIRQWKTVFNEASYNNIEVKIRGHVDSILRDDSSEINSKFKNIEKVIESYNEKMEHIKINQDNIRLIWENQMKEFEEKLKSYDYMLQSISKDNSRILQITSRPLNDKNSAHSSLSSNVFLTKDNTSLGSNTLIDTLRDKKSLIEKEAQDTNEQHSSEIEENYTENGDKSKIDILLEDTTKKDEEMDICQMQDEKLEEDSSNKRSINNKETEQLFADMANNKEDVASFIEVHKLNDSIEKTDVRQEQYKSSQGNESSRNIESYEPNFEVKQKRHNVQEDHAFKKSNLYEPTENDFDAPNFKELLDIDNINPDYKSHDNDALKIRSKEEKILGNTINVEVKSNDKKDDDVSNSQNQQKRRDKNAKKRASIPILSFIKPYSSNPISSYKEARKKDSDESDNDVLAAKVFGRQESKQNGISNSSISIFSKLKISHFTEKDEDDIDLENFAGITKQDNSVNNIDEDFDFE